MHCDRNSRWRASGLAGLVLGVALATSSMAAPSEDIVATVGGTPITRSLLEERLANKITAVSYHRAPSPEVRAKLTREALDELVDEELLRLEAGRLSIVPDAEAIDRRLKQEYDRFGGEDALVELLKKGSRSLDAFKEHIKRRAAIERLLEDQVDRKAAVGRDEAKAWFDSHPERYVKPRSSHIWHALVSVPPVPTPEARQEALQRAEAIAKALTDGADPATISTTYPGVQTRDLGWIHEGALMPEVEKAAFETADGAVSSPIKTIYGYHLVRVLGRTAAMPLGFDDVAPAVIAERTKARAAELRSALLEQCRARWSVDIRSADVTHR